MEEIIKKPWDYILYKQDQQLILSVLCGSSVEFFLNIPLDGEELNEFKTRGEIGITELASRIRYSPSLYSQRSVEIPE